VVLVYVLARRRCDPFFAVVLASLLLFMGSAWQNTMWAFQIGFIGSVVAGLLALLLIERDDRLGDLGAAASLGLAVLSSGVGIPFLAAVGIELLLQPRRWSRLASVAGPAVAAYGIWALRYGDSQAELDRLDSAGDYMAEGTAGSFAGLLGADMDWGRTFAGAGAVLLLVAVATGRVRSPRLAASATGLCAFFFLTAIGRGANATASRYLYIGGVFILLGAAELLRGVKPRPVVMALVLLGAACGIKANLAILDAGTGGLEAEAGAMRAELAAVEIARDRVPADHFPDTRLLPTVKAGPYLAAVDDLGSPAFDDDELQRAPDADRAGADRVLLQSLVVDVAVDDAPRDPPTTCRAIAPAESVELATPRASVITDRETEVRLRRFSDTAVIVPIAVTPFAPTAVTVEIPADRSQVPWRIEASEPALLCVPPVTG
jgi:hypothetical protein